MGKKEFIIKKLKEFLNRLNKDINIEKIFLFGSRASDSFRKDSDIDLVIVSSDFEDMNFIERGARMYNYWNLDYPVDFLCYTPEEFNKLKKEITIVKKAVQEGIIIT